MPAAAHDVIDHGQPDCPVRALALQVIDRILPCERWDHCAHLALGLYLVAQEDACPCAAARRIIWRYNEAIGTRNSDQTGYHHTITLAHIHMIRVVRSELAASGLADQFDALCQCPLADKAWIHEYWTRGALFSVDARRDWLTPDLAPLPGMPPCGAEGCACPPPASDPLDD